MKFDVGPESFGGELLVELGPGESVIAEPGAHMCRSDNVKKRLFRKRSVSGTALLLTGEAPYMGSYHLPGDASSTEEELAGHVLLVSPVPGAILVIEDISVYAPLLVRSEAFMAAAPTVELALRQMPAQFTQVGLPYMQLLSGHGQVALSVSGAVRIHELAEDQGEIFDPTHLLALQVDDDDFDRQVRLLRQSGELISLGGDGVYEIGVYGPAIVWTQTMPPSLWLRWAARTLNKLGYQIPEEE